MSEISVMIYDSQDLTRAGLVHLVGSNKSFSLKGVIEDQDHILARTMKDYPDVLVMDYTYNDPVMLSLIKQLINSRTTNLLIITNEFRKEAIQVLLDMGIKGIVTKGCSEQEINNAIEALSKNSRFYCNRILDVLVQPTPVEEESDNGQEGLSARELEVLRLITKGQKTVEIADQLNVSVHTINSHRKNILRKLNLKSPTELIVYALETGLVKA